jgi:hypothetical protein
MSFYATAQSPPTNGQRIYSILFPGSIPPALEQRFLEAWDILAIDYSQEEHSEFQHALEIVDDLEALELVCRRKKLLPVLGAQVSLMVLLAETLPSHAPYYVQLRNKPFTGFLSMTAVVLRTAWKYLKGSILLNKLHAR